MVDPQHDPQQGDLEPRLPTDGDLVSLCRELNRLDARYIVIGGFAIIASGYPRTTVDVDLMIDPSPDNEAKVYRALEHLPDQAVRQLDPGDVTKFTVVRIADVFTVDLMASAGGLDYAELSRDQVIRTIDGVPIPFASPRALWRMKKDTHREKDAPDLLFLRQQYPDQIFEEED